MISREPASSRLAGRKSALPWTQLDLTMSHLKALVAIADEGSLPIGRVAAALGVGKPASLLVEALVQLDLVVRDADTEDRRRTLVRLSAGGQELIDRLTHVAIGRLREWLAQLDDAELAAMARGLRALVAVASSSAGHAAPREQRQMHGSGKPRLARNPEFVRRADGSVRIASARGATNRAPHHGHDLCVSDPRPRNAGLRRPASVSLDLSLLKTGSSGFGTSDLHSRLAEIGIEHVLRTGAATNGCVLTTFVDAIDLGYHGYLVSDATATTYAGISR